MTTPPACLVVNADDGGAHADVDAADYQMLVDILPTLGHVGEGHCHCETR